MPKARDAILIRHIERALDKVAMLIEDGQTQLAPIFERLEDELAQRTSKVAGGKHG